MSSVRNEVMDAQNSMLHQSNLVADILNNIENLYRYSNKEKWPKSRMSFTVSIKSRIWKSWKDSTGNWILLRKGTGPRL